MIVGEEVAAAKARAAVDCVADGVGEGFEERVERGVGGEGHVRSIVFVGLRDVGWKGAGRCFWGMASYRYEGNLRISPLCTLETRA